MELFERYASHPFFKKLIRTIEKDEYLFRQGQKGNTMFIILEGMVQLIAERDGEEHLIAVMESGQFLGEKALVKETPYQRVFSAKAATQLAVLEIGMKEVVTIQRESPELMLTILKRSFQIAAERLDRANYLIRVLRSSDNVQRLRDCLLYLCRTTGQKVIEGTRVALSAESVYYFIDMELDDINAYLTKLTRAKLIVRNGPNHYIVPDETALLTFFDELAANAA